MNSTSFTKQSKSKSYKELKAGAKPIKYREKVLGKQERLKLPGQTCKKCQDFYESVNSGGVGSAGGGSSKE